MPPDEWEAYEEEVNAPDKPDDWVEFSDED
jgi:hypothetical protein